MPLRLRMSSALLASVRTLLMIARRLRTVTNEDQG
jgi:ABC-type transport system involved in Fe-S cluster assembly fused permease/ATPase subunit